MSSSAYRAKPYNACAVLRRSTERGRVARKYVLPWRASSRRHRVYAARRNRSVTPAASSSRGAT